MKPDMRLRRKILVWLSHVPEISFFIAAFEVIRARREEMFGEIALVEIRSLGKASSWWLQHWISSWSQRKWKWYMWRNAWQSAGGSSFSKTLKRMAGGRSAKTKHSYKDAVAFQSFWRFLRWDDEMIQDCIPLIFYKNNSMLIDLYQLHAVGATASIVIDSCVLSARH